MRGDIVHAHNGWPFAKILINTGQRIKTQEYSRKDQLQR
jgi:hypothetical protein